MRDTLWNLSTWYLSQLMSVKVHYQQQLYSYCFFIAVLIQMQTNANEHQKSRECHQLCHDALASNALIINIRRLMIGAALPVRQFIICCHFQLTYVQYSYTTGH